MTTRTVQILSIEEAQETLEAVVSSWPWRVRREDPASSGYILSLYAEVSYLEAFVEFRLEPLSQEGGSDMYYVWLKQEFYTKKAPVGESLSSREILREMIQIEERFERMFCSGETFYAVKDPNLHRVPLPQSPIIQVTQVDHHQGSTGRRWPSWNGWRTIWTPY